MPTQTLYDSGVEFYERLTKLKSTLNAPFAWYPYNTLANVEHLEKLLDGGASKLDELCKGGLILDMGCADGEWAFFLESLGLQVHALDCPITNHNGMAGVHALKEALGSKVEIYSADLDARFELPSRDYALAFFFGTLYHLKNPYYVLEQLARTTRYCLMSTRIARNFHPRLGDVSDLPLAYLLGSDELNADRSNFWIFSPAGLRRLLKRTHWDVVGSYTVRKSEESNPWSLEGDERIFCLVESTYGFPKVELLEGWHAPEDSGWRWTERRFTAKLEVPKGTGTTLALVLEMYVPEEAIAAHGALTLSCIVEGSPVLEEKLHRAGSHTYLRLIPPGLGSRPVIGVEFVLDQAMAPDERDQRERGVIVASLKVHRRS